MRTIKFRAKNLNGVWYYGSLVYSDKFDAVIYFQTGNGSIKSMKWVYVNQETVGQFTSLYDCNGKEIYEGDILKWKADNRLYAVIFKWGMFYASVEVCNKDIYGGFPLHALAEVNGKDVEIVGNIYDNPELIQKLNNKLNYKI